MASLGSAYISLYPEMNGFEAKIQAALSKIRIPEWDIPTPKIPAPKVPDPELPDFPTDEPDKYKSHLSALAGVAIGVASELAGRLFDAVANLGGQMVEAADSSQKFASTLSFAGVDGSTIEQLTASTQAYADQTVYDLTDIRNVTAQLASNGVDNYAQLAEAAGNLNAVAGGNAETFKSVGMVMTQTAGSGKLMTENWNQLTDAIPGASGALQQAMLDAGAFSGNFRDAMENGEISADEFFAAVQKLGMQDVAVQAATSTSTIEGALGNLEASVVGVGSQVISSLTPMITGAMSGLSGIIGGVGAAISTAGSYFSDWNGNLAAMSQEMGAAATNGDLAALMIQDIAGQFGIGAQQSAGFADAVALVVDSFTPLGSALQSMGATLAPLMQALGTALLGAFSQLGTALAPVVPMVASVRTALVGIATQAAAVLIPILTQIASFIGGTLVPIVAPAIQSIVATVQAAIPLVQTIITAALSAIQAAWNAVWPVLAPVVQAVFSVVSTVVQTVMGAVQGVISAVMAAINGDWSGVWSAIQGVAGTVWSGIQSVISTVASAIQGVISGALSAIQGVWDSVWGSVSSFVSSTWDDVSSTVSSGIDSVIGFISGLPGQIMGFFSDAGSWLINAGSSIIDGLISGIQSAIGGAISTVSDAVSQIRSFFPFSPAKRGPFSGHGYTTWSGRALMRDWGDAIARNGYVAVRAVDGVMGDVRDAFSAQPVPPAISAASYASAAGAPPSSAGPMEAAAYLLAGLPGVIRGSVPDALSLDGRTFGQLVRRYQTV